MNNPFESIEERLGRIESHLIEFKNHSKNNEDPHILLSVEEAAAFLNIAVQTLYGYTSQRRIPFIKKEKKLYFDKADLLAWLKEGRQRSIDEILASRQQDGK
jgi:excisionase family DNA binding protein